jgi:uncharacterized membrane protein YeaQ/YmgE (transglycosylase-associated protein family)
MTEKGFLTNVYKRGITYNLRKPQLVITNLRKSIELWAIYHLPSSKNQTMKVVLTLFTFLFIINCQAQHKDGSVYFSPRVGYLDIDGFAPRPFGGMELEFMVSDRWGIHYTILGGQNYFHMPLMPIVGALAGFIVGSTKSSSDSSKRNVGMGIIVGIIGALIPEGISYTMPISTRSKLYVAPYISPLQFEYLKTKGGGQDGFAGGAVGLRFHQYFGEGKSRISPYFEYKIHYAKDLHPGFSAGLMFSWALGH